MENYNLITEDIDIINNGRRLGIKTDKKFIPNLFFVEYIEPILVVIVNKKKKKYDISNCDLYIYKIDETKTFIEGVSNYIANESNAIYNIADTVKCNIEETIEYNIEDNLDVTKSPIQDNSKDKKVDTTQDYIYSIICSIIDKVEIQIIAKRFVNNI